MANCTICGRELSILSDPYSMDCGGNCLACMAEAGDPDSRALVYKLDDLRSTFHGMKPEQVDELIEDWQAYHAKMTETGWEAPEVPTWLEILRNSVRRSKKVAYPDTETGGLIWRN